jgi:hypothetical protein
MDEHERDQERGRQARARETARPEPAGPERRDAGLLTLASAVGNAAFGRLARDGAGILPGGLVHPDVEQAIAAQRGTGRSLDAGVRGRVEEHVGEPLSDVRVHDDAEAAHLARAVSARAFTTGTDLFFGHGEYRPGTSDGDRLIAHELAHVVQQRGAPQGGPMNVSEPGDAMETEADQVADQVTQK